MPPATTTTSPSVASSIPQAVPKGPRTPSTSPGRAAHSARVTAPTARMVWRWRPDGSGVSAREMGTSPTPGAHSMQNWPGRIGPRGASTGTSSMVTVSANSS